MPPAPEKVRARWVAGRVVSLWQEVVRVVVVFAPGGLRTYMYTKTGYTWQSGPDELHSLAQGRLNLVSAHTILNARFWRGWVSERGRIFHFSHAVVRTCHLACLTAYLRSNYIGVARQKC